MAFKKGQVQKAGPGRPKGVANKANRMFMEALSDAVEAMQNSKDHNLFAWGKKHPTEFWKIASKLLPTSIQADIDVTSGGDVIRTWSIQVAKPTTLVQDLERLEAQHIEDIQHEEIVPVVPVIETVIEPTVEDVKVVEDKLQEQMNKTKPGVVNFPWRK
jgi:hypothetical protein